MERIISGLINRRGLKVNMNNKQFLLEFIFKGNMMLDFYRMIIIFYMKIRVYPKLDLLEMYIFNNKLRHCQNPRSSQNNHQVREDIYYFGTQNSSLFDKL